MGFHWYGGRKYGDKLLEDSRLRRYLSVRLAKASVSRIVIRAVLSSHVTIIDLHGSPRYRDR